MPNVGRRVVKAPNEEHRGDRRANGFLPLAGSGPAVSPPNNMHGDRRGGSASLAELTSPVSTPDHRFMIEDAEMPQPPSAFQPGKGAIPVNPSVPGGQGVNKVYPVADMARPRK
jgi:hypothetical protein